ncbi:MAG: peptidylprolyl isomerase [Planctomycetota bacterium]
MHRSSNTRKTNAAGLVSGSSRARNLAASQQTRVNVDQLEHRMLLSIPQPDNPNNTVVELDTNFGEIYFELFEQQAPGTVANFLNYVNDGDYDGTFFHRAVLDSTPGISEGDFVLQGGGFGWNEQTQAVFDVPTDPPIVNEFGISNTQWTVSMAKLGGDPDSATSQFFISLQDNNDPDNPNSLDNQNGGFTVFAQVIGGFDVVDQIARQQVFNLGGSSQSPFTQVPVSDDFPEDFITDPNFTGDIPLDGFIAINTARVVEPTTIDTSGDSFDDVIATPPATQGGYAEVTPSGDVIAYYRQPGGDWQATNLTETVFGANNATAATAIVDELTGEFRVFTIEGGDLRTYVLNQNGSFVSLELSSDTSGQLGSSLVAFQQQTTSATLGDTTTLFVAATDANGDLELYRLFNGTWNRTNLGQELRDNGLVMPEIVGDLTSYVTFWGQLTIAGLDSNGAVQTVWTIGDGTGTWNTTNLSAITGAPAYQGGLTTFVTSWGAINLVGVVDGGNTVATWWVPSFGGDWQTVDYNSAFGGPQLQPGTVSAYVTPWNQLTILGLDENGNARAFWWVPGFSEWLTFSFNDAANAPLTFSTSSTLTGDIDRSGVINVFGEENDGDVSAFEFNPNNDAGWISTNLNTATGVPV